MAMLNSQMVYLTGVHPLLEVWRDEMLAMLASLSHPQEVHRRCQAWFSCCYWANPKGLGNVGKMNMMNFQVV
jgi:hypothetical protein